MCVGGGYNEAYLSQCVHLFILSLFLPSLCETQKFNKVNSIVKACFMIVIIALSILLFDQHNIMNTIYIDYIMAILTANLLVHVLFQKSDDCFSIIYLSIGCSFLVLTKQIGITLYLMVLFLYFLNYLFEKKSESSKFSVKKLLFLSVSLIIIPLSFWRGWSCYVHSLDLEQQFKLSDLRIGELRGIVLGNSGEDYQKQAAKNYIEAIRTRSLTTSSKLSLSYFQCLILIVLLLYLIWYYRRKFFKEKQLSITAITLLIGFYGYSFVMLVMYVFSFGPREGPGLASFNRYMPTYILVCVSLIIMMFIYTETHSEYENRFKTTILVCAALFLIQDPGSLSKLVPKWTKDPENIYQYHANIIRSKTENNAKVFIFAQTTVGDYQYYVKYYINPRITNLQYYTLPIDEIDNYQKYFETEVEDYMLEYDYVYLLMIDDDFKEKYGFIFENQEIKAEELYRIKKEKGKIRLEKVE